MTDRASVRLNPDAVTVDVSEFAAALEQAGLGARRSSGGATAGSRSTRHSGSKQRTRCVSRRKCSRAPNAIRPYPPWTPAP